ncbi:hypothetical protein HYW75_02045 [Candidatus Pacearchaeota archaeon]|nr:hypothetical protein [Candidatus Pacearchaeota archaeon]
MTTKYLIVKTDKGYEAKFESSYGAEVNIPMRIEETLESLGFNILHRGMLSRANQYKTVLNFLKSVNNGGRFDRVLLEEMLLE